MKKRWEVAQQAEKNFWLDQKKKILDPRYRKEIKLRALRIENWFNKIEKNVSSKRLFEIGGGATQLIDHFPSKEKHALDPLSALYQKEFGSVLDPNVIWKEGRSEELPYADEYFDVVVICNVIDHTAYPEKTMSEIRRVLKKGGLVYISVNSHTGILFLYKFLNRETEHPHVYSHKRLKKLCLNSGFAVADEKLDDEGQQKRFTEVIPANIIKRIVHDFLLKMNNYHFSELILRKP